MARFKIELKRSAAKEIEAISVQKQRQQILARIAILTREPRPSGSQKLSGDEAYRIRQGDYSIIYTVEDDRLIVTVVKVGHRRDVYR